MRSILAKTSFFIAAMVGGLPLVRAAEDTPAWIKKSNANAQVLLDALNKFSPEGASQTGFPEFDTQVTDLGPQVTERYLAAEAKARDELAKRLLSETDPLVRQDLEILVKAADDDMVSTRLNDKLRVQYTDVGQLVFFGTHGLLQEQVIPERRKAAFDRLKLYTGLTPGSTPITELAKARYLEKVDATRVPDFKARIEQSLANVERYTSGIRDLYKEFGLDKVDGAPAALDALEKQLKEYADWTKATVLPKARTDFRLPAEIYADNLKNIGLDIAPEDLIQRAQVAFTEIRGEMAALAPLIAKERGWKFTDYRDVIRELKKEQLGREQVEPYYHEVTAQIEAIIRRERIVTLPERAMIMRVASEAENAAQPAPHMQPPPLVNNKGERGQFVLTTGNPPAEAGAKTTGYDDFTFKAAAWTLTAHEGRPGHELQFSAMVERGVSLPRTLFAFNSVNVEGWALYAEAEMRPYEPLEGQLITLQLRLQRAARAFMDPMLNLGLMTPERAHDIMTQDVCLSEAMAKQEVDRYTFRSPGQATAYFYGYTKILQLRTATEVALGAKFDRLAFNDFIIGEGLLPPNLLAKAVRENFIPAQLKK